MDPFGKSTSPKAGLYYLACSCAPEILAAAYCYLAPQESHILWFPDVSLTVTHLYPVWPRQRICRISSKDMAALYRNRTANPLYRPLFNIYAEAISTGTAPTLGQDSRLEGPIRVSMIDAFATHLLMPDLASFAVLYPEIELQIPVSYETVDLDRHEADVAVRFSKSPPDHLMGRACPAARWRPLPPMIISLAATSTIRQTAHGLAIRPRDDIQTG